MDMVSFKNGLFCIWGPPGNLENISQIKRFNVRQGGKFFRRKLFFGDKVIQERINGDGINLSKNHQILGQSPAPNVEIRNILQFFDIVLSFFVCFPYQSHKK